MDLISQIDRIQTLLTAPTASLPFVGPTRVGLLRKLCGDKLIDILWHLPSTITLRSYVNSLHTTQPGDLITFKATILTHKPGRQRQKYTVVCSDGKNEVDVVFFHGHSYLPQRLPIGQERLISGKIEHFVGRSQIVHPDFVGPLSKRSDWEGAQPIYALTAGVTQALLKTIVQQAQDRLNRLNPQIEWIPETFMKTFQWPSWHQALKEAHNPKTPDDLTLSALSRQRLAFDEALAHQLSLLLARRYNQSLPSHSLSTPGLLAKKVLSNLTFNLTAGQQDVIIDILHDMTKQTQMLRLLQGDVGSGKTLVALIAACHAVEAGFQVAFLTPTDTLARQHLSTLHRHCEGISIRVALLTGREKGKAREEILEKIRTGQIDCLVGTHALIEDPVIFQRLGLAIIDEQHRFGVEQRLKLSDKGTNPHILSLSATPIPRTLVSLLYGDCAISLLKEKPAGRQNIQTRLIPASRLAEVVEAIRRALDQNIKAYWVCPLVEDSEKTDLTAALARFEHLHSIFGERVGLIHGKMAGKNKDSVMTAFSEGSVDILVSTTVIEVGVDVPTANVMVIENAQRFGLSQLHQLRGRIGRGVSPLPPTCLLVYSYALSEQGRQRLEIMRDTTDGFIIAEQDLKLRGGGEVLGTQQSGWPRFRFLDFAQDSDRIASLMHQANELAKQTLRDDPHLLSDQGKKLRLLLHLFKKDKALRYMQAV